MKLHASIQLKEAKEHQELTTQQKQLDTHTEDLKKKRAFFLDLEHETARLSKMLEEKRKEKSEKEAKLEAVRVAIGEQRLLKKTTLEKLGKLEERKQDVLKRREHFYPNLERQLLDQYLQLKGNIRVFVRVRPILPIDFKAYQGTRDSF